MYRKPLILALTIVLLLAVVPMARAITFGQPDGNGHPNVGAMIVEESGVLYFYCSGVLIAPDVFLTAAHCTYFAAAYGADPHDVWVTFDPVYDEDATLHPGTYDSTPTMAMTGMTRTMWPSSSWRKRSPASLRQRCHRRDCSLN